MRRPDYYIGRPVESLQTMLRLISDTDPRIQKVVPDGQYGGSTYASVRSFQKSYALPVTGLADLETWNKIISVFDKSMRSVHTPALIPRWSSGQRVEPGMFHYHLYIVQAMLAALADFFPVLTAPQLTGTLDMATQDGLRWVQHAGGLQESGHLDTSTWNTLNAIYRSVIGTSEKE